MITDEKRRAWGKCHLWPSSTSPSRTNTHSLLHGSHAITHTLPHIVPVTPSKSDQPSPWLSYVSVGNTHLTQTTNGTAVSSDWHPHHCRLTNRIATLACQGADSSDFRKGSSTLIVYVCLQDLEWPRARLAAENPNMCTQASVSQGPLFFTHACTYSRTHTHTQTHSCPLSAGKSTGKH